MANIVNAVLNISGPSGYDGNGGDFDILRDLLLTADAIADAGLINALSTGENLTVFAPDDDAFMGLAGTVAAVTGNDAPTDEEASIGFLADTLTLLGEGDAGPLLTGILTYHVAGPVIGPDGEQAIDSTRLLMDGGATMLSGGTITANVISTDPLGITLSDADPVVPDPALDLSTNGAGGFTAIDLDAGNGLIHTIEGVLLPLPVASLLTAPNTDFKIGDSSSEIFVTGSGKDYADGNGGNDFFRMGSGSDVAIGGTGEDVMFGGRGNDTLIGGADDDFLVGSRGMDKIEGGSGNDIMIGGSGADQFVFKKGSEDDTLFGFGNGPDRIDLSGYEGINSYHDIEHSITGNFLYSQIELHGGDTITLIGFNVSRLDETDFIF